MGSYRSEVGRHYIVELSGCNTELLKDVDSVRSAMIDSAEHSNAKILDSIFFQFDPFGVSGVILISSSHFAIHTWPEHNYAALDILTCGEMNVEKGIESLKQNLRAGSVEIKIIPREFLFQV